MSIAIGVFDGVHNGHRDIFENLVKKAHEYQDTQSMVITFAVNPKIKGMQFTDTLRLRKKYAESFKIDHFTVIDFSEDFSKISGSEFIRLLCTMCRVKAVIVGEDFKCGAPETQITAEQLGREFASIGFDVDVDIRPSVVGDDQMRISSTRLRELIRTGNMDSLSRVSGRPYELDISSADAAEKDGSLIMRKSDFSQILPPEGRYRAEYGGILTDLTITPDAVIVEEGVKGKAETVSILTKEL
ncbi:MAG: FAD synthetase family protein [Bullifex sp.]